MNRFGDGMPHCIDFAGHPQIMLIAHQDEVIFSFTRYADNSVCSSYEPQNRFEMTPQAANHAGEMTIIDFLYCLFQNSPFYHTGLE